MDILAATPCLFMFSIGTFIGCRGLAFILNRITKNPVNGSLTTTKKSEKKDPNDDYRMIIGIRTDLKMQKGKVAAQCGHAAVAGYAKALKEKPKTLERWMRYGCAKITVKVESEEEMLELHRVAQENDIISSIVRDAGQTQVPIGARTVICIGPGPRSEIDKVTGHLKLY